MSQKKFVREATGLVRQLSLFDAFVVNFGAASITTGFIVTTFALWLLPGANIELGIIITTIVLLAGLSLVYSLFAATMPRSGGDYIYISRSLHPALGFAGNFTQLYANAVVIGASAIYTESFITNGFVGTGLVGHYANLVNLGVALGAPLPTFIIGSITIAAFGLISLWSTKNLMRIVAVLFVLSILSVLISIFVLAGYNSSNFVSLFNGFIAPYANTTDPYHHVINATQQAGYVVPQQFNLNDTFKTMGIQFSWIAYAFWFTYMGGEMKSAASVKRQYFSIGGATVALAVLSVTLFYLVDRAIGHQFLASMYYAYANLPGALPIPTAPYFNLFVGMMTNNYVLTAITSTGFIAGSLILTAILFPMVTRVLLAYSFDRVFPSKLADVNSRFGTPHVGILVATVFGVVSLGIFTLVSPALFASIDLGIIYGAIAFDFGLVAVASIVFPYRKKDVYAMSPAKRYEIGGVSLFVIAGVVSLAGILYAAIGYFSDPAYGIAGIPWVEAYILSVFIVPLVAFFVIRAIRIRQGMQFDAAFAEIPPE